MSEYVVVTKVKANTSSEKDVEAAIVNNMMCGEVVYEVVSISATKTR